MASVKVKFFVDPLVIPDTCLELEDCMNVSYNWGNPEVVTFSASYASRDEIFNTLQATAKVFGETFTVIEER